MAISNRKEPDQTMYLHSHCHPNYPSFLERDADGNLRLECVESQCNQTVFHIRAAQIVEQEWLGKFGSGLLFSQACHPDSAVWGRFTSSTSLVEFICYKCKNVVGSVVLCRDQRPMAALRSVRP